jgi:hypothetical protein
LPMARTRLLLADSRHRWPAHTSALVALRIARLPAAA